MAGTNVPKFHNEDIDPNQKLSSALEKTIIAYGSRVNTDQKDFVTLCDEVINKETCGGCIMSKSCMSSTAERR